MHFAPIYYLTATTNGFSDEPSPLVISVLAFRLITGRTPYEAATLNHGFKLPDGITVQTAAFEPSEAKRDGESVQKYLPLYR